MASSTMAAFCWVMLSRLFMAVLTSCRLVACSAVDPTISAIAAFT